MTYVTPTDTNCRYRAKPSTIFGKILGYLKYGTVYKANPEGDWYFIPSLTAYAHKSVVKIVGSPNVGRTFEPPVYISQWSKEANARVNDCGPTCVAMFLRPSGDPTPINDLRTNERTGLTDAPELVNMLVLHGMDAEIVSSDPTDNLSNVEGCILLVNYTSLAPYAQDYKFKGWHWLILVKVDGPEVVVLDPDYWGSRITEGGYKRYPLTALRSAFRPYSTKYGKTTAIRVKGLRTDDTPIPGPIPKPLPEPAPPPSTSSKFGWHCNWDANKQMVERHYLRMDGKLGGCTVVDNVELANSLVAKGVRVMFRKFIEAPQTYQVSWLDGKDYEGAYRIGYGFYYHGPHRAAILTLDKRCIIKIVNECAYHPMDYAFWTGMMAAADEEGRKLAIFGDSSGTPDFPQWTMRIPAMKYAHSRGHYMTVNAYGRTNPDGSDADYRVSDNIAYEYFGGRYIKIYDMMPADARPPLIIGETGASNSRVTQPWAVQDAIDYDKKIRSGKYADKVLFFSLYTLGTWLKCSLDGQIGLVETLL